MGMMKRKLHQPWGRSIVPLNSNKTKTWLMKWNSFQFSNEIRPKKKMEIAWKLRFVLFSFSYMMLLILCCDACVDWIHKIVIFERQWQETRMMWRCDAVHNLLPFIQKILQSTCYYWYFITSYHWLGVLDSSQLGWH